MSNQTAQSAPTDSEEENQQEESQYDKSYEGKLAVDLYRDHSSQNKVAIEVFIVAAAMGVGYTKEVIDAYNILKKPLDPKKLVTNLEYRKQVQRALQLVQRHEGGNLKNGRSKYTGEVNRTKAVLGQVRTIDSKIETTSKGFISQFAIDAKRIYGLSDKEFESVKEHALQRLKDYPGQFSPREALRIEARNISIARISDEVKSDKNIGRSQKNNETSKRVEALELDKKDVTFLQYTTNHHELQKQAQGKITEEGIQSVAFTLGVDLKQQASPPPSAQPAPVPTPPPPRPVQPQIISKIPFKFSLPSLNLSKIFHPFSSSSLLGKLDNFLKVNTLNINRQILNQFKNLGSTLKIGLGKIGSKILGKLGSGAISKVAAQALGSLIPGIGNAAAAIFSALGLDDLILRFAFQAALFAVLVVVGVFVFIIIGANSLFSTNTPDNPMIIPQSVNPSGTSLNWQEFEEKYLSMTNRQEVRPLDTWEEFSQLLTLDTDRHDEMQK